MRLLRRLALLLLFGLACAASPAQARSLVIERMEVELLVNAQGELYVTETLHPHFYGAWQGLYRVIPVDYRTPQGSRYRYLFTLTGVSDENNSPLKYQVGYAGGDKKLKIWVPGADNAVKTVKIRYTLPNALRFFPDHDELYWNVTGNKWEIPIASASARIYLPQGVSGVKALAFTGPYGATDHNALIEIRGNYLQITGREEFAPGQGLTIAVKWNPGIVARPTAGRKLEILLLSNSILLLPILVFLVMFWLWITRGHDPQLHPIAAAYEPPENLTPGEVGTLADNTAALRDITATILDLAVRGYLQIKAVPNDSWQGLSFHKKKDYLFTLRKSTPEWSSLKSHESELLNDLFPSGRAGELTRSCDLENSFYLNVPLLRESIFDQLLEKHYYLNRPDKIKSSYLTAAGVIALLSLVGGFGGGAIGLPPAGVITAGLLSALSIAGFGYFMPRRTYLGSRALERVLGLREFLYRVDSDRFARVIKTPEMFEKLLPYAMALGVEKNWAKAFANIYQQPPEWFSGGDFTSFDVSSFTSGLSDFSSFTASALSSLPSSGSSGFGEGGFGGGGGFSGGGGGGGGGGGF
jgi:hypothetical protein